jgi:hypothetical protein
MSRAAAASLKVLVYLASLAAALVAGHLVAAAVGDALPHHMPAASALMAACALGVLIAGTWAEERMLWRGWFRPSRERLQWVGRSKSSLLTSGAPAPLCLGLALGLVSPLFI